MTVGNFDFFLLLWGLSLSCGDLGAVVPLPSPKSGPLCNCKCSLKTQEHVLVNTLTKKHFYHIIDDHPSPARQNGVFELHTLFIQVGEREPWFAYAGQRVPSAMHNSTRQFQITSLKVFHSQ